MSYLVLFVPHCHRSLVCYEGITRDSTVFFTRFSLIEWILSFVFAISVACSVIDCSFCFLLYFLDLI